MRENITTFKSEELLSTISKILLLITKTLTVSVSRYVFQTTLVYYFTGLEKLTDTLESHSRMAYAGRPSQKERRSRSKVQPY